MHMTFSDTIRACRPIGSFVGTRAICSGVESTGNPKDHPELAAVLRSLALPTDKLILCDDHPVVVAFRNENPGCPFIVAPDKAKATSSLLDRKDDVFCQFRHMLGGSSVAPRASERPN